MKFGFFGEKKTRRTTTRHARRYFTFRSIERLEDRRMLVNDAPNLAEVAPVTSSPGLEVVIPLTVSDAAGETPAAELFVFLDPDEAPAGATIDNATRTLRWTVPANQQLGPVTIVAIVTDKPFEGTPALADAEAITVNIVAANQPPVNTVPQAAQTVAEDTDLVFSTANGNTISIADPDAAAANVRVTLSVTNGDLTLPSTTGLTFSGGSDGTDDATMTFTGTITAINAALNGLQFSPAANFNGAVTLTIVTNDQGNTGPGGAREDTDTVTINVTPVADTPTITPATTPEDTQTTSGLVVTPNAADLASVTHVKITNITNGTLFLSDGTTPVVNNQFVPIAAAQAGFRFRPNDNFVGTGSFQIQASTSAADAGLGGAVVTANITVQAANDNPSLAAIPDQTVERGQPLTFTVTATDIDLPADTLTFSIDPEDAALVPGAAINPTTGAFTWTPGATQALGAVTIRILVTDSGTPALSDSEEVTITVTGNSAPVITAIDDQTATEGTEFTFDVAATDPDTGDVLTYALAEGAPAGMTINATTGVILWTPTETQQGAHTVTVTVSDNRTPAASATETFVVTVAEVNQAPTLTPIGNQTGTVGTALTFTAVATDPDNPANTVIYSLVNPPTGATINETTGAFTWTPTTAGPVTFTVRATDNGNPAMVVEETITVTVNAANQAPVIAEIANQNGTVGTAVTFDANATDADGDDLTFSLDNEPEGATIDPVTGAFTWTPTATQLGPFTFQVVVTDDGNPAQTDTEEVTITVA
jgi:hypothetical protein